MTGYPSSRYIKKQNASNSIIQLDCLIRRQYSEDK